MKSLKNRLYRITIALSLLIFSAVSCEVGLGAAVDTEPPELFIQSPAPASIIRGTFAIKGTWTDDRDADKVSCVFTNTADEKKKYTLTGEVVTVKGGEGTWNIFVEDASIPDGSYEVTVSLFDKSGHETKVVRQFDIDNTAPVIVLKRPSSRKGEQDENIDRYGQLFTLNGFAADDSGVGLIEVSIYSDEALTQQVGETISIKNVPNTITRNVAEFEEGVENAYSAIYGSTERSNVDQKRWCKVVAYDGAQFYPADGKEQTDEDKKGNASFSYYLYEDISSTFLSQYKVADLYAMRKLGSPNTLPETTAGVFILNPANNPYYTVSGYQELKLDGTDTNESMYLKNGNSIVISLKPGLDSYEIDKDSLKVYLQQCDMTNNGEAIGELIPMENITKEPSGTAYTITLPVKKGNGINIGKSYRLYLEGQDVKGNKVTTQGNGYGFYIASTGVKPSLRVDTPPSAALVSCNDSVDSIVVKGMAYFPSESCEGGSVIIKDSVNNLEWLVGTYLDEKDENGNTIEATQKTDIEQNWSITLNLKKDSTNIKDETGKLYIPDGIYTFNVYAITDTDFVDAESAVSVERNIKVDTQKPKAPVLKKLNNTDYSALEWYKSKNLKVDLEVSDEARNGYSSGLFKTEYSIGDSNIWTTITATSYGYINGLEDGENKLIFRSVDEAGNVSDISEFTVKLDTVAPVITKAYIGKDSAWKTFATGNVLNIKNTDGKKIKFEIEEALTLPEVSVTVDGKSLEGTYERTEESGNKWIWISNTEASLNENQEILIKAVAKDGTNNEGIAEHKVLVDTEGPVIEFTSPVPELELRGENSISQTYILRAGITDKAGNVAQTKYLLTDTPYTDENNIITDARSGENGWELSQGKGSIGVSTEIRSITKGKWYLYVYSKDEADNESYAVRYFWFDTDAPSLGVTAKPANIYNKKEDSTIQIININGTASDSNGIDKIEYSTDGGNTWNIPDTYNPETGAWSINLTYGNENSDLSDGSYKFIIRAADKAGRNNSVEYNVLIDTVSPELTLPDNDNWYHELKISTEIQATDVTSKVSLVQYNTNYDSTNPDDGWIPCTYNDETETASGDIDFESSGIKTVYIKATDGAGNEIISSFTRKVDADKPTLTAKYTQIGTGSISNYGGTAYVNGSTAVTFWGDYSDSISGVAELEIKIGEEILTGIEIDYSSQTLPATKDDKMPSSFNAYSSFEDKTAIKSWKVIIPAGKLKTGAITIIGRDKAVDLPDFTGNEIVAQQTTSLALDTELPVISSNTINVKDNSDVTKAYLYSAEDAQIIEYFLNNSEGKNFTVSGISTDNSGVASTKFKIGEKEYTNTKTAGSWSFTVTNFNSFTENEVSALVETVDLAGNKTEKTIKFKFDTTAPDKSGIVKIDNNEYASGIWRTSTVLTVSGVFTEEGSGVSKIYYKRFATSEAAESGNNSFATNYRNDNDGFIEADATGKSYNGKITKLSVGNNYLLLIAEDNVGNSKLIDATPYYIRIDTKAPAIESTSGGTRYSNGKSDVIVTGTCSDEDSGVAGVKVSIKIDDVKEVDATKTNNTDWSGGWTATIPAAYLSAIEDGKNYDIEAVVTDNSGLSTPLIVANLQGDTNPPEATLNSVSPSVAVTEIEAKGYVRPNNLLTVKGISEDEYSTTIYTWLKLIPYKDNGTTADAIEIFESTDENHTGTNARSWTLSIPADTVSAETYAGAKLYACTKDLAGNTKDKEIHDLIFDVTGPVYMLSGSENNFVPTTIGGKSYSADNWYNSKNLLFTGTWKDAAGVTAVYYEIVASGQSATITKNNATTYPSFTLTSKGKGLYVYNSEIRGFNDGGNTIIMYAKDALGNISNVNEEIVRIDTNAPEGSEYTDENDKTYNFNSKYFTNAKEDSNLILYFYAKDGASESGIDISESPEIKFGTEPITQTETTKVEYANSETTGKGYLVTLTFNEKVFAGETEYIPVVAVIKDKAGNSKELNIGTVTVDSEPPVVNLSTPKDADSDTPGIQVNKTISIKGNANDKNLTENPLTKLQYSTDNNTWNNLYDATTNYTASNTTVVKNETDFSVNVNTTQAPFEDTKYYLRAAVEDKAGNEGWSDVIEFTVDQNTDRPVITFMDITISSDEEASAADEETLKLASKKLRITVSDDDGIDTLTTTIGETELTNPTRKNDSWIYDLTQLSANSQIDGTYSITFTVKDSSGEIFTSGQALAPRYSDGEHQLTKTPVSLSLMIDNTSPMLKTNKFIFYSEDYPDPDDSDWLNTPPALGGKRNKLALLIEAGDENKISGVTAKLTEKSGVVKSYTATVVLQSEYKDTTDKKYYSKWLIKDIDVSENALNTGDHNLEFTIIDGANNEKPLKITLSVDREVPEINITSPTASTYSSGSIRADGSIAGAVKLYYAVSPDGTKAPDGSSINGYEWTAKDGTTGTCAGALLNPNYGSEIEFSGNWIIYFDGNLSADTGVHTELLNTYLENYGITTEDALKGTNNATLFTAPVYLYLWLKAEDEVGNETEKAFPIVVNPQGDRPTAQFTYPLEDGVLLGQYVNIRGTYSDTLGDSASTTGVRSVWIQLLSKACGGTEDNPVSAENFGTRLVYDSDAKLFSKFEMIEDDLDYLADNGYDVYNMETYSSSGSNEKWIKGTSHVDTSKYSPNDYAALVKTTDASTSGSWNITINSKGEFDPNSDSTDGKNPVGIRIFAKDGDGKLNTIQTERFVYFDSDTPAIKDLQLVQYDKDNQETIIATRTYTSEMYISNKNGPWKLIGTAWDNQKITNLKFYDANENLIEGVEKTEESLNEWKFSWSLPYDVEVGTISIRIEVDDDLTPEPHTGRENINIRFDSKEPVLITDENEDYNIKKIIRQNNSFYTFSSVAIEDPAADGTAQSGFAYTAFYFTRNTADGTKLYDILSAKGTGATPANVILLPEQLEATDSLCYEDNMYWYKKTVAARGENNAANVLKLSGSDTKGIRKNCLVKIDGAFYKVTSDPDSNSFEIDGNPQKNKTEVLVAVASLIDNTTNEKTVDNPGQISADGYYSDNDLFLDDGDRMLEFVDKTGTSWNWKASVCSKNISDGPITLHYVVFDAAGNYSSASTDCIIANNTPRLAGFTIKTDRNNNGNVDDVNIDGNYTDYLAATYSALSMTSTGVYDPDAENSMHERNPLSNNITAGEAGKPVMTLRGKTVIIPEIVGGTGKVYYDYDIQTIDSETHTVKDNKGSNIKLLEAGSTDYTIKSKEINIQLGDLVNFGDIECTEFKFTFHDSMEERDSLTDTTDIDSHLSVYMGIAASATSTPTVKIDPFYWKDLNNNSIYGSKSAASYKDLQGHIELEDDLPDNFTENSGEMDTDPKVSGKIVLTGSVEDNNLINTIKIEFGSFIEKTVAEFKNGHLTLTTDASGTGYEFKIKEGSEKFTKDGHFADWILNLYTEEFGVALDAKLTVTATNYGTPDVTKLVSEDGEIGIDGSTKYKIVPIATDYNAPQPKVASYQMDIVPYITDVTTFLSSYSASTPSMYARSARGRYSVYAVGKNGTISEYEKIKISGFNLTNGTVTFNGAENNTQNMGDEIKIPSGAKSGEISISVLTSDNRAVVSLNNKNNNESRGIYGYEKQEDESLTDTVGTVDIQGNYSIYNNYYNRIPNNKNNNNLTDDVYLNIWDFNKEAALADSNSKVDNLEMKINPNNGLIGFAFSNGSTRFSMPKADTSYTKWNRSFDYMKHNALAYDINGNSYAVSVGGDINGSGGYDFFSFMSSRWTPVGGDAQADNKTGGNHLNLDAISSVEGDKNTRTRNKDRFQSQSIATNGDNIYLAYYDMMYSQIRFKAGVFPSDNAVKVFGNFRKRQKKEDGATEDYGKVIDDAPYCQIIADGTTDTFGNVGEYVSIGVMTYSSEKDGETVSNDVVAIVWYDGNNLQFAYGVNPLENVKEDGTATKNKVKNNVGGWVGTSTPLISGGGEYCQLAVARDNSIHIAAYNSSKADLEYIYIPFDDTTHVPNVGSKIVCSVDTYLDVGEQLTIDVAEDVNGNQIPYIGYWGAYPELPRYAYLADPNRFSPAADSGITAVTKGAIDNTYTGVWECMVVPSQSSVKDSRKINVGVWKYNGTAADNGKLAYSTTGTNRGKVNGTNSYNSCEASTTNGKCYGNGTNNGVLAYVVTPSSSQYCAETAQLR